MRSVAAAPTWSRLTDARPVFGFLALSGGLWLGALVAWQLGRWDLAVVLTGLGAAVPILWMVAHLYWRPATWVLRVPVDPSTVEIEVLHALREHHATAVVDSAPSGDGLLRGCEKVLRVSSPACIVRWRAATKGTVRVGSALYLVTGPRDAAAVHPLREAISSRFQGASPGAA